MFYRHRAKCRGNFRHHTTLREVDIPWLITGNSGIVESNFIGTMEKQPINIVSGTSGLNGSHIQITTDGQIVSVNPNKSVYIGELSGEMNSGIHNVAIGNGSLATNTIGTANISIGSGSLGNNTSGSQNISIGSGSLAHSTVSSGTVAIGYNSLNTFNNEGGLSFNTAIGYSALSQSIRSTSNTALGYNALANDEVGSTNIAIGSRSMSSTDHAALYNVGIGSDSLT